MSRPLLLRDMVKAVYLYPIFALFGRTMGLVGFALKNPFTVLAIASA